MLVRMGKACTVRDKDGKLLAGPDEKKDLDAKLAKALIAGGSAEEWTPEKEAAEVAAREAAEVAARGEQPAAEDKGPSTKRAGKKEA